MAGKVRSTILIVAAIAGGAPIFHSDTKPVSFEEKEKATEASLNSTDKKEKLQ